MKLTECVLLVMSAYLELVDLLNETRSRVQSEDLGVDTRIAEAINPSIMMLVPSLAVLLLSYRTQPIPAWVPLIRHDAFPSETVHGSRHVVSHTR